MIERATHALPYNPSLDGLRAIAVLVVVLFHTGVGKFGGGFIGVDVFFVLSGYLITSILRGDLKDRGRLDVVGFYWNRALRLYPPLILMLAAWAVLMPLRYPDLDVVRNGLIAMTYLSDYVLAFGRLEGHLGHTWSLAVEEHFYLIWPLVILATARWRDGMLCIALLGFFTFASAWRVADFMLWDSWQMTYHRFDTRLAGLTLGAAIAVLPRRLTEQKFDRLAIPALFAVLLAAILLRWGSLFAISCGMAMVHLATACLILALRNPRLPVSRVLACRPLVYLGLLSYSIYLWHFPMAKVLLQVMSPETVTLIILPASILLAAVSYEWVEKPLRQFRRKKPRLVLPEILPLKPLAPLVAKLP